MDPQGAVFIPRPITFELLFLELREPLQGVWFECFEALNVDHNALVKVREKYSKDPKIGVVEAMRLWLETRDPPPSWSALVHVLQYIVMETELADRIEKYYVNPPSNQRPCPTVDPRIITSEDVQHSFGVPGTDHEPFEYLLTEVLDIFNDGCSNYTLSFIIHSLCCPDGSTLIGPDIIRSNTTVDGIFVSLILHSYISSYDIDFLVHLLKVLDKIESVRSAIDRYYDKRTLGKPFLRKIKRIRSLFLVRCVFQPGFSGLTFAVVTDIKTTLKSLFCFDSFPYIIQFMGWSTNPVSLYFQLPQTCMTTVRQALEPFPTSLKDAKINEVILEVGSTKFTYKL